MRSIPVQDHHKDEVIAFCGLPTGAGPDLVVVVR
jgi:hypothetical protein